MILSRIAKALREQNWFAVTLEFVIVIAGVVIGFQINAWNAARELQRREEEYLVELLSDFRAMTGALERMEANTRYEADLAEAIGVLQSCPPDETAWDPVRQALARHRIRTQIFLVDGTYEEMVASGALARLEDTALKAQIKYTYSLLNNNVRVSSAANAALAERASAVIVSAVPFAPDPDSLFQVSVEPEFEFQSLCDHLELNNAMLDLWHATRSRERVHAGVLEVLRETEGMLAARVEPAP